MANQRSKAEVSEAQQPASCGGVVLTPKRTDIETMRRLAEESDRADALIENLRDIWTVKGAFEGMLVPGGMGSGKTTGESVKREGQPRRKADGTRR